MLIKKKVNTYKLNDWSIEDEGSATFFFEVQ